MNLSAQISEGGIPPSFSLKNDLRTITTERILNIYSNLDNQKLIWEDSIARQNDNSIRVAENISVDIDIDKNGEWITLSDSVKVWKQTVFVSGAKGIIMSFKSLYIPDGGKLFIYNSDRTQVLGAYTHNTNPKQSTFFTEMLQGDTFTIEYVASTISEEKPVLEVDDLGYVYDITALLRAVTDPNLSYNDPDNYCIPNVNCLPAGSHYQDQKRGVVLLLLKYQNRWNACSGSLINNTKQDGTPYILSASHCFAYDNELGTSPTFKGVVAYFNYEEAGCESSGVRPNLTSMEGGTLLSFIPLYKGSDGALLKLSQNIPSSYKVYYNGWDRSTKVPVSGGIIHHPIYDIKKLTLYGSNTSNPAVNIATIDNGSSEPAYFRVVYNGQGVTAGGSSGAPLFNEEGLIVGTLTSGQSTCKEPLMPDYYARFYYHWDKYSKDPYRSLYSFLDPDNTGVEKLAGYDPNGLPAGKEEIIGNTIDYVIFPNPVIDEININSRSIIRTVAIYDLQGRQLFSKKNHDASTLSINVSNFTPGIYSIIIVDVNGVKKADKFIKK